MDWNIAERLFVAGRLFWITIKQGGINGRIDAHRHALAKLLADQEGPK